MPPDKLPGRAADLRRLAEEAKTPEVREQFLLMAADWERLAGQQAHVEPPASEGATTNSAKAGLLARIAAKLGFNTGER